MVTSHWHRLTKILLQREQKDCESNWKNCTRIMSHSGKQAHWLYRKRFVTSMQQMFAQYDGLKSNENLIYTYMFQCSILYFV